MPNSEDNRPTLKVVALAERLAAEEHWEEDTQPEAPMAVTNAVLLRAIKHLDATFHAGFASGARAIKWLAVSVGALALVTVLLWVIKG